MLNLDRDDFLHRLMSHDSFARHSEFFAHGSDTVVVPSSDLVFLGDYSRTGDDLVIGRAFESVTIHDYFKTGNHPNIEAPGGATLSNAVVSAMTISHGGEQFAANAAAAAAPKAIGRVEEVSGTAEAIRSGQTITLHPGDLVYKGDAVQTGPDSNLALTFLDGTAFSLASDARMVLNDMTYEPKSSSNASLLTLVQGSIGFVAGDVAHTGDMKVDTPVATMGIRGTAVRSQVNSDSGKGDFSLLREPDGHVGSIVFYDHRGSGSVLGFLSSASTILSFEYVDGKLVSNYSPATDLDNDQDQNLVKFLFHIRQLGLDHPLREELGLDQPGGGQGGHGGSPQTPEQEQRQDQDFSPAGQQQNQTQHLPPIILTQFQSSSSTTLVTPGGPSVLPEIGTVLSYPTTTVGGSPVVDPPTGTIGADTFSLETTQGSYGTASINPSTGVITYTETKAPAPGTAPTDTFSVLIRNSQGTTTVTASFVVDGGALVTYTTPTVGGTTPVPDTLAVTPGVAGTDTFSLENATGSYGTASINPSTGVITYTETKAPAPGTAPTDTFSVLIKDSEGVTTTATASFVVDGGALVKYTTPTVGGTTPVLDTVSVTPGVAGADTFSLQSGQGSYGTASINASTGVITYTETSAPAPGTAPTETFTVLTKDSQGVTTTATASFVVDGGGSASYAPTTVETAAVTDAPTKIVHSAEGGDTFSIGSGLYGTATIDSATGAITYTPTATASVGQALTDTFTVTDTDKLGMTTTSTATFIIDGGGSASYAPTPVETAAVTDAPTKIVHSAEGGDTFSIGSGLYGTATIDSATGAITYTPTATASVGQALTDTFTVTDTDKLGVTTTSTATFIIDGGALVTYTTPTVAGTTPVPDSVSITPGVAGADTFSLQSGQGSYGTASINASTGVITYTETSAPTPGTAPTETFTVLTKDSQGVTTTATASFVVDGGALVTYTTPTVGGTTRPVSVSDTLTVSPGVAGTDMFSLESATGSYGTASINPSTGVVTYTETSAPAPGTAPTETFTVLTKDSQGVTTTATATFIIDGGTSANYGPPELAYRAVTDTPVLHSPEGGDSFAFSTTAGPVLSETLADGKATIDASTGAIIFTPTVTAALGHALTDTLTVTDTDKLGVTTTSTATFIMDGGVLAKYTAPTVTGTTPVLDSVSVTQGVAGADAFSLQSSQGHYGTATIDPTSGVVTFTETTAPAAGTAPTETFIVFIKDPEGVTTTATASFVIDGGASVNYTTPAVQGSNPVTNMLAVTSGIAGSDTYSLASTQGTYGTASINPSTGLVTYTETTAPAPGTAPSDTFSVLIKDSQGVTTTATASFVVDGGTSANYGPPEVASGKLIITPVLVSPEGGDTFKLVSSQGVYGNASIASSTGAVTYTPTASAALGQPLTDTFTVTDTDKLGVTTTSTVTVILDGGTLPPGQYTINGPTSATFAFPSNATTNVILAQPSTFTGQFSGFAGKDTIDLPGFNYSSANFSENYTSASNSLVLTVTEGANVATLTFDNFNPSKQSLSFASDGANGTLISDPAAASSVPVAVSATAPTVIPLPAGETLASLPTHSADGAALESLGSAILYNPTASSALSHLDYGQSAVDHVTYVDGAGTQTVSFVVEGLDHGPAISGLVANASAGSGNSTDVTITGAATGLDDLGSIQFDAGGPVTPFSVVGGEFSIAANLSAGDHVATLTLQDQSTAAGSVSGVTTRQIDIDIGGGDAPTIASSTGGPAILVGSANSAVSQTIIGTPYADTLVAGAGNDVVTGNGGGDTFVFKPNMGNDVITDFHANSANGPTDVVDVSAFHFASYQALLNNVTDTPAGDVISLGTHTVTLEGVHTAQLHASLFHL